jgi:hypothetical protein
MHNFILYMVMIIILLFIILLSVKKENINYILETSGFSDYNRASNILNTGRTNINALNKCQVPTLTTDQCYKSRYFECPIVNGTLLQCTNNYIPKPTEYNADCGNRTFDMVPYPWKISENCYYNKIGFSRNIFNKVKYD